MAELEFAAFVVAIDDPFCATVVCVGVVGQGVVAGVGVVVWFGTGVAVVPTGAAGGFGICDEPGPAACVVIGVGGPMIDAGTLVVAGCAAGGCVAVVGCVVVPDGGVAVGVAV